MVQHNRIYNNALGNYSKTMFKKTSIGMYYIGNVFIQW
jgi:hypothetical protein